MRLRVVGADITPPGIVRHNTARKFVAGCRSEESLTPINTGPAGILYGSL